MNMLSKDNNKIKDAFLMGCQLKKSKGRRGKKGKREKKKFKTLQLYSFEFKRKKSFN